MPLLDKVSISHRIKIVLGFAIPALLFAPQPTSAQKPAQPFVWEEVGYTQDCNPNPAFERLLSIFSRRPMAPQDEEPVFDEGLFNAVQGDTSQRLFLDVPQNWHGLKLRAIEFYTGVERGPVNYVMVFDNSAEEVRAVWNKLGWKIPPGDETREMIDNYAYLGVQSQEGGRAAAICWRD